MRNYKSRKIFCENINFQIKAGPFHACNEIYNNENTQICTLIVKLQIKD